MDIRMPRLDGFEATRALSRRHHRGPDHDDVRSRRVRVRGAAGWSAAASCSKTRDASSSRRTLVAAGDSLLAPSVTRRLIDSFVERARDRAPPTAIETLSGREREVLELVAQGMSNAEIAAELILGEATIKSHVSLLTKLGVRDRVQAVIAAYENGLDFPSQPLA